jgi:hypothetical protein
MALVGMSGIIENQLDPAGLARGPAHPLLEPADFRIKRFEVRVENQNGILLGNAAKLLEHFDDGPCVGEGISEPEAVISAVCRAHGQDEPPEDLGLRRRLGQERLLRNREKQKGGTDPARSKPGFDIRTPNLRGSRHSV